MTDGGFCHVRQGTAFMFSSVCSLEILYFQFFKQFKNCKAENLSERGRLRPERKGKGLALAVPVTMRL